jgi:hypothetical protein
MQNLSDESLFSLWKAGNEEARSELTLRYYQKRHSHAYMVAPSLVRAFGEGEVNHCVFCAFENCLENYETKLGGFETYYLSVLTHEMTRKARSLNMIGDHQELSLDAPISGGENDDFCLHDVVSSGKNDDPAEYLNYVEEAYSLGKLPKKMDKKTLVIARLRYEKCSYEEIAGYVGLTPKQVRNRFEAFLAFLKSGISLGSFEEIAKRRNFNAIKGGRPRKKKKHR